MLYKLKSRTFQFLLVHLQCLLVLAAVPPIRCQPDRVVETEYFRNLVYQIDGIALELRVSGQFFGRVLPHAVRRAQDRRHDERFVLQYFDDFLLLFAVAAGEVHPGSGIPRAALAQTLRSQLDNVQHEIAPEALVVELDDVRQATHFHLEREDREGGKMGVRRF